MDNRHRFVVCVEGFYNLTAEDIWPDGDAPENPTTHDVAAVMEACGSRDRVLDDWMFMDGLTVAVLGGSDKPAYPWAKPDRTPIETIRQTEEGQPTAHPSKPSDRQKKGN